MINTLNETSLHKTLKTIYSFENEGSKTEQQIVTSKKDLKNKTIAKDANYANSSKYIFDVVTEEGNVIEIQTGNLGHLLAKTMYLIQEKRKITIVYPLAKTKYIQTENLDKGTVKRRKSPVSKNIFSIFREFTTLCPVLLNKYFTLEILDVTLTEERTASDELMQSNNNHRRFRKNWNKTGKHLDSIDGKLILHGKKSWLSLLPKSIVHAEEPFTVLDLYNAFVEEKIKVKKNEVQLVVWVFAHMGVFEFVGKKGRAYLYKIR